jgi:hypothetical protein
MKQSEVTLANQVPIRWLVDYVSMLRATLGVTLDPGASAEEKAKVAKIDRAIERRIRDIEDYLARLRLHQLN